MIDWDISNEDFRSLVQVAERVENEFPTYPDERRTLIMDLNACHSNGCPLDFKGLLEANPQDFSHDIWEIRKQIDRNTGKLGGCFVPRYALANRVAP